MKNYLTAAAFLAAGTALANAGTPVFSHTLATESLSDTLGATTIATVVMDGSDYQAISGSSYSTNSVLFYFTGTYVYSGDSELNGDFGLGFYNDGGNNKSGFWACHNWDYDSNSPSLEQSMIGPNNNRVSPLNSGTLFNRSSGQLVSAAETSRQIDKVAVSFGLSSVTDTNYSTVGIAVSVLYADGTSGTLYSGISTSWLGSSSAGNMTFDLDGYSYDPTYVSSVSITTNDDALTTDMLSTLSLAAVPEPSAFGLIAGAGALALVASRRRRAK